jgi:hypothetical protein
MKEQIKKYVDDLFADVYETEQLQELKEEISANLLEKVNDFVAKGNNEDTAFKNAISSLGDMSELVESLKKASRARANKDSYRTFPLDKKHALGYAVASAIFLLGVMAGGFVFLFHRELVTALITFSPFLFIAAPVFGYFGLTQETGHHYGMKPKRALAYTLAGEAALLGIILTGIMYLQGRALLMVIATFMPFIIVAGIPFLYLGLTEKSRRKINPEWAKDWVKEWTEYYSNPHSMMLRGSISGALWIFAIGAFILVTLIWGWKFSWVVFIVAVGLEVLMDAFFAAKRK